MWINLDNKYDILGLELQPQGADQKERYMTLLDEIVRDNGLTDLVDGIAEGACNKQYMYNT